MAVQQFYPQIQSIQNQPDLAEELRTIRQMIYSLQAKYEANQTSANMTPAQLKQIQTALQIGGSNPLNVTKLLGN